MKIRGPELADYVILPEVVAAMVYALLVRVWHIYQCCTLSFKEGMTDSFRLLPSGSHATLTAIHVAFGIAFCLAGFRARESHPNLRKGHFGGLIVGALTLMYLQAAINIWHRPLLSIARGEF